MTTTAAERLPAHCRISAAEIK